VFGKRSGSENESRASKPAAGALEPASGAAPAVSRSPSPPWFPLPRSRRPGRPRRSPKRGGRHLLPGQATIFGALIEAIDLASSQARRRVGARKSAISSTRSSRSEHRDVDRRAGRVARRHLQRRSRIRPLERCCRATTSPTSWSTAPARCFIEVAGRIQRTGIRSATISNCSTSASASSARSAGASTNLRRSATPASPTARASTPSCRRWRSTARADDPQIQEGQADARPAGQVRRDLAGRR